MARRSMYRNELVMEPFARLVELVAEADERLSTNALAEQAGIKNPDAARGALKALFTQKLAYPTVGDRNSMMWFRSTGAGEPYKTDLTRFRQAIQILTYFKGSQIPTDALMEDCDFDPTARD